MYSTKMVLHRNMIGPSLGQRCSSSDNLYSPNSFTSGQVLHRVLVSAQILWKLIHRGVRSAAEYLMDTLQDPAAVMSGWLSRRKQGKFNCWIHSRGDFFIFYLIDSSCDWYGHLNWQFYWAYNKNLWQRMGSLILFR